MRRYLLLTSAVAVLMGCLSSCSSEEESLPIPETNSVTFSIGIDAQTRAAQALDVDVYDAKMYLFEEKEADDGTLSYSYKNEVEITTSVLNERNELTIGDLTEGKKYKAVFLARPKNQAPAPALPTFSTTKPSYKEAKAQYISNNEIDKDIFRSIVSFTFSSGMGTQSTVLTRQNGALEVRLKNLTGVKSLKLHALGHQWMYLEDGTGGMVITDGDRVALEKNMEEGEILKNPQDVRIRLNILPQEDITSKSKENDDFYLEVEIGNETKRYPIKSDHEMIPIYPNQVTWLTLTNMDGLFDVNFGDPGIDLDDNFWDGWDEGWDDYYVEY